MGKYTALRKTLPPFEQPQEWVDKVSAFKLAFLGTLNGAGANTAMLARAFSERNEAKKALEEKISFLNIELEGLSSLLVEALEDAGLEKIDLAGGGYVRIDDKPYSSVENREEIMAWIKKNKLQDLLSVNYQTLSGMNNDRLVNGKPIIPGTKIWIKTKAAVRGVGGKDE